MKSTSTLATLALLVLLPTPAVAATTFFHSPSGNIGCAMSDRSGVRCDIAKKNWKPPPRPPGCTVDWGNGVEVHRRGRARFTCAGDTTLGMGRKLRYGSSIQRGRFRCNSTRSGMRCLNRRNRHGFNLSRERVRVF